MTQRYNLRDRQAAERRGRLAEKVATLWLMLKGYQILDRRVQTRAGELDLIARKGATLVFAEIKSRKTLRLARQALQTRQRLRIERASLLWMQKQNIQDLACRFDVICVALPWGLTHIKDAWRPNAAL